MSDIHWTNERRRLGDLTPWPRNPRQIREAEAERLRESVDTFGQVETLAIGPQDEVYNGHQRLNVLAAQHGPDYEIDVRVSSRALTEKEREKLTVYLHKGAAGEWNFDKLADEFNVTELLDWGFEEWQLGLEPKEGEWADAFGALPDGDRAPFQQMTFTLHDTQVEQVKEALKVAKAMGRDFTETLNENSNGNALALVCEAFVTAYGEANGQG